VFWEIIHNVSETGFSLHAQLVPIDRASSEIGTGSVDYAKLNRFSSEDRTQSAKCCVINKQQGVG
jgi:hypothetical protein